ncbi:MAG: aminoacyl-tRNA hydrolase [Candidatus Ancillula sp.]|jgi:PTH1 family peptidyl-tRNA hydrolase|nr:aminoacyl-tRNA hydrolase [Candidatus Ancillula sp.]
MWIVCGLGNSGAKYDGTPHNIGFQVVDELSKQLNANWSLKFSALIAHTSVFSGPSAQKVVLVKPQQFMNLSGGPLKQVANYFKVSANNLIVVHDDIDLPFGTIKAKLGGSDAGHNGLRSITKSFNTNEYYRIRLGVGRPTGSVAVSSFVLGQFSKMQKNELPEFLEHSVDASLGLITSGLESVQLKYHTKKP